MILLALGCEVLFDSPFGGGGGGGGDDTGGSSTPIVPQDPPQPEAFVDLGNPCSGATIYALHRDGRTLWVGCGSGMGLLEQVDGESAWAPSTTSENLYVNQILKSGGHTWVCGHDYDTHEGALLFRDGAPVLWYGDHNDGENLVYMADCLQVAVAGDRVLVANSSAGDLSWSEDGGETWSKEERYWEEENLGGGSSYYQALQLAHGASGFYASGSTITNPPMFFAPSEHGSASFWNMKARTVDESAMGEARSLASPDGDQIWLVGGRDQERTTEASGFIYRSANGGQTWTSITLPDTVDVVRDIAVDGALAVAVGHRYPTALGGFVLLSSDGGATWTEAEGSTPILESAAIEGRTAWFGGDGFVGSVNF